MRGSLASVGILLEPAVAAPSSPMPAAAAIDRAKVREVLVARGAPAEDLEWLVRSCLALADAYDYQPPQREAWCPRCSEAVPCNARGCIYCQAATSEASP